MKEHIICFTCELPSSSSSVRVSCPAKYSWQVIIQPKHRLLLRGRLRTKSYRKVLATGALWKRRLRQESGGNSGGTGAQSGFRPLPFLGRSLGGHCRKKKNPP